MKAFMFDDPIDMAVTQLEDGQGRCLVCAKSFSRVSEARRHHREVHSGPDRFEDCQLCGAQFRNRRYRDEHLKRKHGITKKMLE